MKLIRLGQTDGQKILSTVIEPFLMWLCRGWICLMRILDTLLPGRESQALCMKLSTQDYFVH